MIWQKLRRRSRDRQMESERAIERSERLGEYIDMQQQDAAEVSEWARERLKRNHLTDLFLSTRGST